MKSGAAAGENESCETYVRGTTIAGKYTLERLIGSGASGSVWMASHPAMGLSLAIKIVHAHEHPDGVRLLLAERLAREARAAARIRHPAIVRVFDLGMTSRGDPFIAMELLHGEPLRSRLVREGRLPPEAAVALLLPIAAGLDAAHARGVVHRDIKPDNIVIELDDSGRSHPKLLDFGVAKLAWLQPGGGRLTGDAIVGTPEYMAPEQALGLQGTDQRVDIWSLSVVLYELVAGTVPFPGQSFEQVLRPIVQDPPPPVPGVDPELWRILERGLQKAPADRFPSMQQLGASLAAWLDARGIVEDISGVSLGQWFVGFDPVLKDARASRPQPPARARGRMHLAYVASLLSGASMAWFLMVAGVGDARSLIRSEHAPQPASAARAAVPQPPPGSLLAQASGHRPAPTTELSPAQLVPLEPAAPREPAAAAPPGRTSARAVPKKPPPSLPVVAATLRSANGSVPEMRHDSGASDEQLNDPTAQQPEVPEHDGTSARGDEGCGAAPCPGDQAPAGLVAPPPSGTAATRTLPPLNDNPYTD